MLGVNATVDGIFCAKILADRVRSDDPTIRAVLADWLGSAHAETLAEGLASAANCRTAACW
jgi:hypothetical protein